MLTINVLLLDNVQSVNSSPIMLSRILLTDRLSFLSYRLCVAASLVRKCVDSY